MTFCEKSICSCAKKIPPLSFIFFGFLPLTESHTLVSGEYQDWLLIQLFQLYEKKCHSFSKEEKLLWFQNACRILDHYFIRTGHPKLRFMHFKALDL